MIQIEPIGNAPRPLFPSSIILQDALPIGQTRRRRFRRRRRVVRPRVTRIPGRGPAIVTRRGGQTSITPLRPRATAIPGMRAQVQIRKEIEGRRLRRQAIFVRETRLRRAREKRTAEIVKAGRSQTAARRRRGERGRQAAIRRWQASVRRRIR